MALGHLQLRRPGTGAAAAPSPLVDPRWHSRAQDGRPQGAGVAGGPPLQEGPGGDVQAGGSMENCAKRLWQRAQEKAIIMMFPLTRLSWKKLHMTELQVHIAIFLFYKDKEEIFIPLFSPS